MECNFQGRPGVMEVTGQARQQRRVFVLGPEVSSRERPGTDRRTGLRVSSDVSTVSDAVVASE